MSATPSPSAPVAQPASVTPSAPELWPVGAWQQGYNDAVEGRPNNSDALPQGDYREYADGFFEGDCDRAQKRYS